MKLISNWGFLKILPGDMHPKEVSHVALQTWNISGN